MSNRRHNLRKAIRAHHAQQAYLAELARLERDIASDCEQTRAAAIAKLARLMAAAGHEVPAEVQA